MYVANGAFKMPVNELTAILKVQFATYTPPYLLMIGC
jgi:hypothetical protein